MLARTQINNSIISIKLIGIVQRYRYKINNRAVLASETSALMQIP